MILSNWKNRCRVTNAVASEHSISASASCVPTVTKPAALAAQNSGKLSRNKAKPESIVINSMRVPAKKKRSPQKAPIPVRAVDFIMYSAKNMRRTRAFYQKLFGFKKGSEWNDGWSEFNTEPVTLCLDAPGKGKTKSPWQGPPAIAFAVADIHAAIDACHRRKVKVLIPATETRVCWMAFIADPEGNRICLHQRKDGTAG
jgi:predicted enzyme related to lactoylglutathione lyase